MEIIYDSLEILIDKWKPQQVAIEELFFNTNITTGIKVAEARGVILLSTIQSCGKLYEYTPLMIKQALTGNGRADIVAVPRDGGPNIVIEIKTAGSDESLGQEANDALEQIRRVGYHRGMRGRTVLIGLAFHVKRAEARAETVDLRRRNRGERLSTCRTAIINRAFL